MTATLINAKEINPGINIPARVIGGGTFVGAPLLWNDKIAAIVYITTTLTGLGSRI